MIGQLQPEALAQAFLSLYPFSGVYDAATNSLVDGNGIPFAVFDTSKNLMILLDANGFVTDVVDLSGNHYTPQSLGLSASPSYSVSGAIPYQTIPYPSGGGTIITGVITPTQSFWQQVKSNPFVWIVGGIVLFQLFSIQTIKKHTGGRS